MQVVVQAEFSPGGSVRDTIVNDHRLFRYDLTVSEQRRKGRCVGWAKLHGHFPKVAGAVNIEWMAASSTLLCRIVTRAGDPGPLAGRLIAYLLSPKYRKRLRAVLITYK